MSTYVNKIQPIQNYIYLIKIEFFNLNIITVTWTKFVPCREKTDIKLLNYYIQKTKPKNNIFCEKKVKKNKIKLMNELISFIT